MFILGENEGWAFLIGTTLGLLWPLVAADARRPDAAAPSSSRWSAVWWLLYQPLVLITSSGFWKEVKLYPMGIAAAVSGVFAALWLLVFGWLAERDPWAQKWLGLPLGRIAGLIWLLTISLWMVDEIHSHGLPWLTPANVAIGICAVAGLWVGSSLPSIVTEFGIPPGSVAMSSRASRPSTW
jgi:hypothetical protein